VKSIMPEDCDRPLYFKKFEKKSQEKMAGKVKE
jgi:hypothetical protein